MNTRRAAPLPAFSARPALRTVAAATVLALVAACAPRPPEPPAEPRYTPSAFDALPGWDEDRVAEALPALQRSCMRLLHRPADAQRDPGGIAGTTGQWRRACGAVMDAAGSPALRTVLQTWFVPWALRLGEKETGLFTGYYEPTLKGSLKPRHPTQAPLHRRPDELVMVDLGRFRDSMKGERIAGRVENGRLVPFPDRAAIVGGALDGRGLELAWADDPVDAFFLQIQGSGRVELAEGGVLRVGYDGQNGHPYVAIGRILVERGALSREEVSLQSIRAWLDANPDQRDALLAANPSYVFFRPLKGEGPIGAEGVALTPGRSLAVDRTVVPLGAPVWLDTTWPDALPGRGGTPLRRLMVAQDTGGAIRGAVRGDVFFGHGERAEMAAGHMKQPGRYWILLPRGVQPSL